MARGVLPTARMTPPEEAFQIRVSEPPAVWDDCPTIVDDRPPFPSAELATVLIEDDGVPTVIFEDERTIDASGSELIPETLPAQPPALPLPLCRTLQASDSWIDELPEAARRVLLDACREVPAWPRAPRIEGAVARPLARLAGNQPS